ncbi:hypothetical protein ARMSODRAFT_970049 [Armillaria solidipes]|uniref:Retrotransposon gag domain-containing protein n=1 Tax=Armillaria solidipes TaxID=1076256 RepID=A0A2H3BWY8_9AGAR|nr:hypothetical protein ARMSODRAFT_970049 [Armillaria solidipes]
MTGSPWTDTLPYTVETLSNDQGYRHRSPQESSPIESEHYTVLQPGSNYMSCTEPKQPRSSATWKSSYTHSPYGWETALTWTELSFNQFDDFNYDEETFGGLIEREKAYSGFNPFSSRAYGDYALTQLQTYPFPLPNSPPPRVRQHGQYHSPRHICRYTGQGDADQAGGRVKPVMMKPPHPFKGEHNDIEQFVSDCLSYFEVFAPYFTLPSLMTTFAASYLEGPAKDWWVYQRTDFWTTTDWDNEPARFRLPNFEKFVGLLTAQFRDPAIEEVHQKKMFEL